MEAFLPKFGGKGFTCGNGWMEGDVYQGRKEKKKKPSILFRKVSFVEVLQSLLGCANGRLISISQPGAIFSPFFFSPL